MPKESKAYEIANRRLDDCLEGIAVFEYLKLHLDGPIDHSDGLRAQIVHAVSALDFFVHELIRTCANEAFSGQRLMTSALLSESMTMNAFVDVMNGSIAASVAFSNAIKLKISTQSFQTPEKIASGLSLIWNANDKWDLIANEMNMERKVVVTQLKLIVQQRNRIAHEADFDPVSGEKFLVEVQQCKVAISFIRRCCKAIDRLIAVDLQQA